MKRNEQKKIALDDGRKEELNKEVMLFVNKRLYERGSITEEMYHKAKDEFLKLC